MVNYKNSTTDFYYPATTRKLQESGAFIVFAGSTKNEGFLVDNIGEHYLTGHVGWLQKTCAIYQIKTVRLDLWIKLTDGPIPSSLFQTSFGARTLEDAFSMRALPPPPDQTPAKPIFDNYSNVEDTFIEQNGFSSGLY